MVKKGQITIYVILGIVLLVSVSLLIYTSMLYREASSEKAVAQELSTVAIENYVEGCMRNLVDESILLIGYQGGYTNPHEAVGAFRLSSNWYVHYDYYTGINDVPSRSYVEQMIEDYVSDNIDSCVNNFEAFNVDVPIVKGEKNVVVNVFDDSISVQMSYPHTFEFDTEIEVDNFRLRREVQLGNILDVVNATVEKIINEGPYVDFSYYEGDLLVETMEFFYAPGETNVIYLVTDTANTLYAQPYKMFFALKFDTSNLPPVIENGGEYEVDLDAGEYVVEIDVEDENPFGLSYHLADVEAGDVNIQIDPEMGELYFTPTAVGSYTYHLYVMDDDGNVDDDYFTFNVVGGVQ